MTAYYEVDFLPVSSKKSGDAITVRYGDDVGNEVIHVVDAGFQTTGEDVAKHIRKYYGNKKIIDHVVVTHPDGDHAGGVRQILEEFEVGRLWMLRPWEYAEELLPRFKRFSTVEGLTKRLKEKYPNITKLEEMALEKGVPICEPFIGASVGEFKVLAPSRSRYLDLVVTSEKTPEEHEGQKALDEAQGGLIAAIKSMVKYVKAKWGEEQFSSEPTSNENEMSVVQYAELAGEKILLTGDAGVESLREAIDNAQGVAGLTLPGLDKVQVPHHGSRRNVSSEILDDLLGDIIFPAPSKGEERFSAVISASKEDEKHPRNSVVRAFQHRGAKVVKTEGSAICFRRNTPQREGWSALEGEPYPEEQEV